MFKLDDHLIVGKKDFIGPVISFTEERKSQMVDKSASEEYDPVKEQQKLKLEFLKIDFDSNEVETEESQQQIVSYLKSIRVCRTDYSIKGNKVVQITDRKHQDHNLFNILPKMHDGQIFEYVLKKKKEDLLPEEEK